MRGIVGGVQAKAAVKREIWKAYGWGLQIPDKGVEPFLSADSKSAGTPNGLALAQSFHKIGGTLEKHSNKLDALPTIGTIFVLPSTNISQHEEGTGTYIGGYPQMPNEKLAG